MGRLPWECRNHFSLKSHRVLGFWKVLGHRGKSFLGRDKNPTGVPVDGPAVGIGVASHQRVRQSLEFALGAVSACPGPSAESYCASSKSIPRASGVPVTSYWELFIESHNPRLVWVGWGLKALLIPAPPHGRGHPHKTRVSCQCRSGISLLRVGMSFSNGETEAQERWDLSGTAVLLPSHSTIALGVWPVWEKLGLAVGSECAAAEDFRHSRS